MSIRELWRAARVAGLVVSLVAASCGREPAHRAATVAPDSTLVLRQRIASGQPRSAERRQRKGQHNRQPGYSPRAVATRDLPTGHCVDHGRLTRGSIHVYTMSSAMLTATTNEAETNTNA